MEAVLCIVPPMFHSVSSLHILDASSTLPYQSTAKMSQDHNICIHSTLVGHLGHFQFGPSITSAAVNIVVHAFWWICIYISVELFIILVYWMDGWVMDE